MSEHSGGTPRLTRSDSWLLAALCEASGGSSMRLRDLIGHADWLNRGLPYFDEASFGLPRLVAAGFAQATGEGEGLRVRATNAGRDLRHTVQADTLGDVLWGMSEAVGAPPYPEPEIEDRSLGRLPGLDEVQWQREARAYRRAFARAAGVAAATGFAVIGAALGVAAVVATRLRRR